MGEHIFTGIAEGLRSFLAGTGVPMLWNDVLVLLLKLVGIILFILVNALWLVYMERKVAGYMQCRIGPNRTGPRGLLQTAADIGKLMSKEFTWNKYTDKVVYMLAAIFVFIPPLMIYAVIPFGENMVALDMNIGLMYFVAIASLGTIILFAAGWASNNKYSLVGGMRAVAQMVSYELPLLLSFLGVIMLTGTLNVSEIVYSQQNVWFIFTQPVACIIFYVAALAETNRSPFCLVEGESEIISGPYTEYSGMPFALFFLTEYAGIMVMSAMFTVLFLGGWLPPLAILDFIPSWIWFFLKMYLIIFIFMWVRWTFPRIRIDQLMGLGWKVLIPLSLANIFVTGFGVYIYRAIGW